VHVLGRWLLLLALPVAVGCGTPREDATPPDPDDTPEDPLVAAAWDLGLRRASYMDRDGEPLRAALESGGASDDHALILLQTWCYKIMAVGEAPLGDLDLALFDPRGGLVETDIQRGVEAALGVSRPICPPEHGTYRLRVRASGDVGGAYAVQVYRSL
jgi:hypothetical protein